MSNESSAFYLGVYYAAAYGDPYDCARAMGLHVKFYPTFGGMKGCLLWELPRYPNGCIWIASDFNDIEDTLAHELGHFVLDYSRAHGPDGSLISLIGQNTEASADAFMRGYFLGSREPGAGEVATTESPIAV